MTVAITIAVLTERIPRARSDDEFSVHSNTVYDNIVNLHLPRDAIPSAIPVSHIQYYSFR